MNFFAYWEKISEAVMHFGMPSVLMYHVLCGNIFLNTSAEDSQGLEKIADTFLVPTQYLLAGEKAVPFYEQGVKMGYKMEQRFTYSDSYFWHKTAFSYIALPSSLCIGGMLKAISYLSPNVIERRKEIATAKKSESIQSNLDYYASLGIHYVGIEDAESIAAPEFERRPQDKEILALEKEALKEIVSILHKNKVFYWLDCGTCLGAYRYGGIIPWDWDIDIAILQRDSENVRHLLNALDPEKYSVQDWSSRDKPGTYLKVYVKKTGTLIDIYHFAIDSERKAIHSILSNGECVFLPDSWKIRERRYTIPTPFEYVFPLKKANFDGVEVFVPSRTKEYLQQRYGDNIGPVKVLNPLTGQYEKDPTHPYWQKSYTR